MPTTSNFGWTTPADTDLVKDGASAIRTLGNGIDSSLVDLKGGTTGQILSKATNADLDYTWITPSSSPLTTKGDLFTYSTTNARLGVGTNGQYLVADSTAATGLKWATLPASGKILQVVSAQNTTEKTIATGTLTDTNLTATITPTATTSTILVMVSQPFSMSYNSGTYDGAITLLRGSTQIWNTLTRRNIRNTGPTSMVEMRDLAAFHYVDSPATTSAITYKTQALSDSGTLQFQFTSHPSNITLFEIGA